MTSFGCTVEDSVSIVNRGPFPHDPLTGKSFQRADEQDPGTSRPEGKRCGAEFEQEATELTEKTSFICVLSVASTSMAPAMMVSVNPDAFSNNGCIRF